jgi:hypothetical protein
MEFYYEACQAAYKGLKLPLYKGLFVESWIYQYGLLDEFSISAYWAGHQTESWLAAQVILRGTDIDSETRARVERTAHFAQEYPK